MSAVLSLDSLKKLADGPPLQAHPVPVYEFGPSTIAWIAELSADERDERLEVPWLEHKEKIGQKSNIGFRAFAAAACWCSGQDRNFIAKDAKAIEEAAAQLGKLDSRPVTRMFAKAAEVNGLTAEAIEELEKNSPPAGDGNGTSPSTPDSPALESGKDA